MSEWRVCAGYPDYEISESGSMRRIGSHARWKDGREKVQWLSNDYFCVKLGRNKSEKVHRLVAKTFIGPQPSSQHEVAHNDGNRKNNHYSNLRWATRKENMADARAHGTLAIGNKSGRRKISSVEVEIIRNKAGSGLTQREIGAQFGLSQSHISGIINNRFWCP